LILDETSISEPDESNSGNGVDRPSNIKELELLLANLANDQKVCMRLFYLKKMSYEKIQTKTGYSYNEIKSALQSGRHHLRKAIN